MFELVNNLLIIRATCSLENETLISKMKDKIKNHWLELITFTKFQNMNLNRPDMITNQAEKTRLDCFKEVVTKRDLCGYQCQTNSEVPLTGSPMQTPVFKPTDENLESDDFPEQDIVSLDLSQQQSAGDEREVNLRKEQSFEGK